MTALRSLFLGGGMSQKKEKRKVGEKKEGREVDTYPRLDRIKVQRGEFSGRRQRKGNEEGKPTGGWVPQYFIEALLKKKGRD